MCFCAPVRRRRPPFRPLPVPEMELVLREVRVRPNHGEMRVDPFVAYGLAEFSRKLGALRAKKHVSKFLLPFNRAWNMRC